jgi:hypothetical protein
VATGRPSATGAAAQPAAEPAAEAGNGLEAHASAFLKKVS